MCKIALNIHVHYSKNFSKLVGFKEQNKIVTFLLNPDLAQLLPKPSLEQFLPKCKQCFTGVSAASDI
jgi:hypothetical protein